MRRRTVVALVAGAAVLTGAVMMLRSAIEPPTPLVTGPDGEPIVAFHDRTLVIPPARPGSPPPRPEQLYTDARHHGVLVGWEPAAYGFEVRWGRAGGQLDDVRYVATPSTSINDLTPGRYRVEVRAVDRIGQRSEPAGTTVEVGTGQPRWQDGLGFAVDLGATGELDPASWYLLPQQVGCMRRDRDTGTLITDYCGSGGLIPTSQLVLSEPDHDGVRGRLVIVTDAVTPAVASAGGEPTAELARTNGLLVDLTPAQSTAPDPDDGSVRLWVNGNGAFIDVGDEPAESPATEPAVDPQSLHSPRALHRWELVFTTGGIEARRDGRLVATAPVQPGWRRAKVRITTNVGDPGGGFGRLSRMAFVGFTSSRPAGGPVQVVRLDGPGLDRDPGPDVRFDVLARPGADTARLSLGALARTVNGRGTVPLDELAVHVGGRRFELPADPGQAGTGEVTFSIDLPAGLVGERTEITVRSPTGRPFSVVGTLELVHPPGTVLDIPQPADYRPAEPGLPRPRLVVRHERREITTQRIPRGELDVEIRPNLPAGQSSSGSLLPWAAVTVELDGRVILSFPTSAGGPAIADSYRFTLEAGNLPSPEPAEVVVTLVPAWAGLEPAKAHFRMLAADR